ncbi:ABC transporter permease [Porphyromonas sp.]|uniref:ABC transporter permease n=1 Tax=Porphyromonas sp. TaxID=1924944 RepID=UPI0026DAC629|nr:ABC transporter permease [Porphyromonas sp.]MDO4695824.1 ABC transporter permease [Porphyromonas sp.]MDO4771819.1 ABC transporter permease [Porphyromonas sp.]
MNKFAIVLKREYLTRVQKKSFLIFTILTPFIFLALMIVPAVIAMNSKDTSKKDVIVIDNTSKYQSLFESDDIYTFVKGEKSIAEYRKDANEDVYAYIVINDDLLKDPKALTIHTGKQIPRDLKDKVEDLLIPNLKNERIESFNIPNLKEIIRDTNVSLNISTVRWEKDGSEQESSAVIASIVGQIFNVLIYMFILMYGMMVMQSVREEKKNRIVEIIISSVKPQTLLFGKICAIGLLGFTQMFIWIVIGVLGIVLGQFFMLGAVSFNAQELTQQIGQSGIDQSSVYEVQSIINALSGFNFTGLIIAFVFYFIFGYLIYASIFAAAGAAVDNDEDVNQMITPITLIMIFAFYAGFYSANNPNGPLALWTSFIPFTSPVVMMVRIPYDPPVWQIALSAVALIVSTFVLVWIAAKIFRVGILLYGKKPSFKELWQWLRYY